MKEKPILFSGPMVRAILDGRKSQTRRVVKIRHDSCGDPIMPNDPRLPCPYGQPGDRLWVREAWRVGKPFDHLKPSELWVGDDKECLAVDYLANDKRIWSLEDQGRYRHARFMPRWASRITLEVTGVRVERLQDISEADSLREGCDPAPEKPNDIFRYTKGYRKLWESINGAGSWAANPWIWVVEFKRINP